MLFFAIISYLWPVFIIIGPIVYIVGKIKSKNDKLPAEYASFERRASAYVVDAILFFIFHYLAETVFPKLSGQTPTPAVIIFWGLSILNIIILPSITGWSVGKRMLSIKIIKKDNKKAGFIDIIYREIVKNCFSVAILFMGCFWMIFSEKKLTWHDSVADTRVINILKS